MNYKKEPIDQHKFLGMYPVYVDGLYYGREPFTIVGIRKDQVELEGDFSGGTHNVKQASWFKDSDVFVVRALCDEEIKTNGCQLPNIHCCGGGKVIKKHTNYWDSLIP